MPVDTLRDEVVLDNTVFTAATRALRAPLGAASTFDFLALVDLTQSLVCYEHILSDATSRRTAEEQKSWEAVTTPWTRFTPHPILLLDTIPELGDREAALDSAARLALSEAASGKFDAAYQQAVIDTGVDRLLPAFYTTDGGVDDERFRRAKEFLMRVNPAFEEKLGKPNREALGRYVFRGLFYAEVARAQKAIYSPSPLRAKLLELSTLVVPPGFNQLEPRAARMQQGGGLDLLGELGVYLKPSSRTGVKLPLVFSYLLTLCEQNGYTIPEATFVLRSKPEMRSLRQLFAKAISLWHAERWAATELQGLQAIEHELTNTMLSVTNRTGFSAATVTVSPLLWPFNMLKSDDLTLKAKLPSWLFVLVGGAPRIALLWDLFKEKTAMTDVRRRFDRLAKK